MTTTNTAWAHLPNAAHIDRVLAHVRSHPDRWDAAWGAAWDAAWAATWTSVRASARDAALAAARGAARSAAWAATRDAAWAAEWAAARDAAWDAARGAAWGAALDACSALVAWDDAGDLLGLEPDALRLLAACGDHRAVLLLPAVLAFKE